MTCKDAAFTPGIDKASAYIESLFKKIGLETFDGATLYSRIAMTVQRTDLKVQIDGSDR
jgi:hypothetical protein